MPIMINNSKIKLMCGGRKIAKMYCEGDAIYSSGNIVTFMVDGAVYETVELEEGDNVLNAVANPSKSTYSFKGWSLSAGGNILSSFLMGDDPITLHAVWQYVGAPFYIVQNGSVKKSLSWSQGSLDGTKRLVSQFPRLYADKYDDSESGGFTASASFASNGNKTIRVAASFVSKGGITVNGVRKYTSSGSGSWTWNISGAANVSIVVDVEANAYAGNPVVDFTTIYLY